jgi:hypothetical protein
MAQCVNSGCYPVIEAGFLKVSMPTLSKFLSRLVAGMPFKGPKRAHKTRDRSNLYRSCWHTIQCQVVMNHRKVPTQHLKATSLPSLVSENCRETPANFRPSCHQGRHQDPLTSAIIPVGFANTRICCNSKLVLD